jgi:hypothetical protein
LLRRAASVADVSKQASSADAVEPKLIEGGDDLLGAVLRVKVVIESAAEPLFWKAIVGLARKRPLLQRSLASRGASTRIEPAVEIGFENADPALRDLHLSGPGPFGEQTLERAPDDARAKSGFVVGEYGERGLPPSRSGVAPFVA